MENKKEFKISSWKSWKKIGRYFEFDKFGTTMKKEIIGGVTTFLALVYILSVQPTILGGAESISHPGEHMNQFGVFIALCISSFLATFIMGMFANIPVAVAPSMGINVMFTFNMANSGGIGYEGALIATTISSILFVIFSITPLRRTIIEALPHSIVVAIGVGIGFFVAYVGLSYIGWVGMTSAGSPEASLGQLKSNYPQIILGSGLFLVMLFFYFKKINGGVAVALMIGLVIALIVGNAAPNIEQSREGGIFASANFKVNGGWHYDFGGFVSNIKNTWTEFVNPSIWSKPVTYISIFVFIFLNFFDATGTLTTFNNQLNNVAKEKRELSQEALVIDSGATIVGSALGTSPLGAFVESGAGIAQGARTGFAAVVTSMFFLLAIALFPIFKAVPTCVSGAACLFVGVMMIANISDIEWKKPEFAISAFLGILFMVVTYTIANGIAISVITYTLIKVFKGEYKDVVPSMWVLPVVFVGYFIAYAFMQ